MEQNVSYIVSFIAGFLTFLSPCFLPLIPSYVVYISGVSFEDLTKDEGRQHARRRAIIHSFMFVIGFSIIFILLGLTATLIGKLLFQYQKVIRVGGGVLIIIFGLYLMGVLKLDFLAKERGFKFSRKGVGYISSILIGMAFGTAWTPCVGPILGSILLLAGTEANLAAGAKLLTVYSMGLAIPFLISSLLLSSFLVYFKKAQRIIGYMSFVGGLFLILVGLALATNYFQTLSLFMVEWFSKLGIQGVNL